MERIGFAKDIHKLVVGRPLILGGVHIPFEKGLLGHSDADVILHALTEAILGALALGDLGKHFPDTEEQYKDVDSSLLVKKAVLLMKKEGYVVGNADISLVLEKPRVAPYIDAMRAHIASLLEVPVANVSVKAGTNEGLDAIGHGDAAEASAIVLLRKV
jgi:2-C-methyl-D-erythritol 2,4-cyclodiphosphate synthase